MNIRLKKAKAIVKWSARRQCWYVCKTGHQNFHTVMKITGRINVLNKKGNHAEI